jgi:hypothetical protein
MEAAMNRAGDFWALFILLAALLGAQDVEPLHAAAQHLQMHPGRLALIRPGAWLAIVAVAALCHFIL